ncbi:effector-associated constant component EACC1 [Actinophytocola sediminis]
MELTISAGGDEQALEQFYHWLREDVDVVRSTKLSTAGSPGAGHMGAFEVICLSFSTLTGLGNLGLALANFQRSRKDSPSFTINVVGAVSAEQLDLLKKLNLPLTTTEDGA